MPMVGGKAFPYTKKGMEAADKARKGGMTGSGMMSKPQTKKQPAMPNVMQEKSKKMDAMRNALSKAAAAKSNLPAKVGDSGMKSEMPMKKGDSKKRNLEY